MTMHALLILWLAAVAAEDASCDDSEDPRMLMQRADTMLWSDTRDNEGAVASLRRAIAIAEAQSPPPPYLWKAHAMLGTALPVAVSRNT